MTQVTEAELDAFVDDQLDSASRIEVLQHLLGHPAACDRVLSDLRDREAMRLLAGQPAVSPLLQRQAAQLDQRRARSRRLRLLPGGVAIGAMTAALALALGLATSVLPRDVGPEQVETQGYLVEAVEAQRAARVRQAMVSQTDTTDFDGQDIRAATRIRVPAVAASWDYIDVQVFPSDYGPSLQLLIRTDQRTTLSLFAVHAPTGATAVPTIARVAGEDLVAWSQAGNTYVLAGPGSREQLLAIARDLADNRFA